MLIFLGWPSFALCADQAASLPIARSIHPMPNALRFFDE
jgi:hypothetical protein